MEEVMLAVDTVLECLAGPDDGFIDELIRRARVGEIALLMLHSTLYQALCSLRDDDVINRKRFCLLLKFSQIIPDTEVYLGPEERRSWDPSPSEVANWRKSAFETC